MIRRYLQYLQQSLRDWNEIFLSELRTIFSDAGVLIFFILVPLGYPLLNAWPYIVALIGFASLPYLLAWRLKHVLLHAKYEK